MKWGFLLLVLLKHLRVPDYFPSRFRVEIVGTRTQTDDMVYPLAFLCHFFKYMLCFCKREKIGPVFVVSPSLLKQMRHSKKMDHFAFQICTQNIKWTHYRAARSRYFRYFCLV